MRSLILFLLLPIWAASQSYDSPKNNPIELGKVEWIRNYDEAIKVSQAENKPIFLLFQEVPGCANCTKYGQDILSHPLMVEAIETEFVPLAIFNNVKGHDREVLVQFSEPTWNNPVVRIINGRGKDLAPRVGDFRSKATLINNMITVLNEQQQNVPVYLSLLQEEWTAEEEGSDEIFLSMYCFWTGEKEIAQIEGVLATEAGYMHGREVVKVTYNQDITKPEKISKQAAEVNCADAVYTDQKIKTNISSKKTGKYKKDRQDKYYLRHTDYQFIAMTELQKSKVNSAIGHRMDPSRYLSPRQIASLNSTKKQRSMIEKDIYSVWDN